MLSRGISDLWTPKKPERGLWRQLPIWAGCATQRWCGDSFTFGQAVPLGDGVGKEGLLPVLGPVEVM